MREIASRMAKGKNYIICRQKIKKFCQRCIGSGAENGASE